MILFIFLPDKFALAQINLDLPTIVIKPCNKAEKRLSSGLQRGKLISSRAYTYKGPSVLCEEKGEIKIATDFIVLGSAQSTFKKPWYRIEILSTGQKAWIPTKYVKLLGKFNPAPQYTTSILENTFVIPTTEVNIRKCPSTRCARIGSANKDQKFNTTKKSSNGWYFVESTTPDISGWLSGQYLQVDQITKKKEISEKPQIPVEVHDPCNTKARTTSYKSFALWRAKTDFPVLEVPDTGCTNILSISKDQAIIPFGESNVFYELAFVKDGELQIGYFDRQKFNQQYVLIQRLPNEFKRANAKQQILDAQDYWGSFRYKFDQTWLAFKNLYTNNPITAWTTTAGLLILLLYLIPKTRWIVLGMHNAIMHIFAKRELQEISSHWNQMVEGLKLTPTEFYTEFENILAAKQIPDARQLSISWPEGGIFSPKRLYYRVARKKVACDICCAPYGNGTFFSCWVGTFPSAILNFFYSLPILSWLAYFFEKFFRPMTYYQYDSMHMFQQLVHSALIECVDKHTNAQNVKPLSKDERKPTMKGFFDNKVQS